jgi:hypothetical protein
VINYANCGCNKIVYWERWLKPELGLNSLFEFIGEDSVLKSSSQYTDRHAGDQSERMPPQFQIESGCGSSQ